MVRASASSLSGALHWRAIAQDAGQWLAGDRVTPSVVVTPRMVETRIIGLTANRTNKQATSVLGYVSNGNRKIRPLVLLFLFQTCETKRRELLW